MDEGEPKETLTGGAQGKRSTPRFERWLIALVLFVLGGVVLGWCAYLFQEARTLNIPDRTLTDAEAQQVVSLLRGAFWTEETAERFAERYGTGGGELAAALLESPEAPPDLRGWCAYVLGKFRDPAYVAATIAFVDAHLKPRMGPPVLTGIASALDGLGFSGEPEAMAYLETLAAEERWANFEEPPYKLEPSDAERTEQVIRSRALRALGLAPGAAGMGGLKRLEQSLSREYGDALAEALELSRGRKWGLQRLEPI